MKLVIQIPCLNEEETLEQTLHDLPREVPGCDSVEWLVVDDGSTDRTVEVAKELGVDHVAQLPGNRGLAVAFSVGLETALQLGADVIVNTDGDNQYQGADVSTIVTPILRGDADIVIGDRQTHTIDHFSWTKKRLQRVGSWVVRRFSGAQVPDATSGFRAFTRAAALQMNILSPYTYTLESIIQAARKGLRVSSVPIRTNPKTRESRLMRHPLEFVLKSAATIVRVSVFYKPLRFFLYISALCLLPGLFLGLRFLWFYVTGSGTGHVQSLILAAVLLMTGFLTATLAVLSDVIAVNRRLVEDCLLRLRAADLDAGNSRAFRGVHVWSRTDV